MKIEVDGKTYLVEWRHWHGSGTDCEIYDLEKNRVAQGNTQLAPEDMEKYNKETGRKLSLARALANLQASREDRTKAWKAYFARKGGANG